MKARGYKVFLVRYRYERPDAGAFGALGGGNRAFIGYGFRDFFGTPAAENAPARQTVAQAQGQRAAVVWQSRRGEFFLVDRYYADPRWLEGETWLEKLRSFDPNAASVEIEQD